MSKAVNDGTDGRLLLQSKMGSRPCWDTIASSQLDARLYPYEAPHQRILGESQPYLLMGRLDNGYHPTTSLSPWPPYNAVIGAQPKFILPTIGGGGGWLGW